MSWKWFICTAVLTLHPAHVISQDEERGVIPCDKGWFYFKGVCYSLGGTYDARTTKLIELCTNDDEQGFTFDNSREQLSFMAAFIILDWWIDIENQDETTGVRDPRDCAEMIFRHFLYDKHTNYIPNSFEWHLIPCDVRGPYICQKETNLTMKTPDPRFCSAEKGGGFKFQSSCYHVVEEQKTWEEAEEHCRKNFSGHLVTVSDLLIDIFLHHIISHLKEGVWIGIKITEQFQQKWSSGWHVSYDDGLTGLHSQFKGGLCVLARQYDTWILGQCSERHPFVCDTYKANSPVLEPATVNGSHCPTKPKGWRDLGGEFCYFFETEKLANFYNANYECKKRGGNLVSIHSKEENTILHPFVKYSEIRSLYIGLSRSLNDTNIFQWTDGSELNYTNWDSGQPDNRAEEERCTEVYKVRTSPGLIWNDIDCRTEKGFICSTKKVLTDINIENEDSETKSHKVENPTDDMSLEVIIPLTVLIVLAFVLLGIGYYFKRYSPLSSLNHSTAQNRSKINTKTEQAALKEDPGTQTC